MLLLFRKHISPSVPFFSDLIVDIQYKQEPKTQNIVIGKQSNKHETER